MLVRYTDLIFREKTIMEISLAGILQKEKQSIQLEERWQTTVSQEPVLNGLRKQRSRTKINGFGLCGKKPERGRDMVLVFTEEQKREIKARGMTVIQTKLILYRFVKGIRPVFGKILDMYKNMSKKQIEEFLKPDEDES